MVDSKSSFPFDFDRDKLFYKVLKETCSNSRLLESRQFIQHGNTSVFQHSLSVAYNSYHLAIILKLPIHEEDLIRGALLHDYFLYDWHKDTASHRLHGFRHPKCALNHAQRDFELSKIEIDIIKRHMFPLTPLPPKFVEGIIVCLVDKFCSVHETFKLRCIYELVK